MVARIFINYRRDDSTATAGRLHDRLAQSFGRNNLFMDVDHIPPGVDFVNHLNRQVAACDVFVAVIGPNWLDVGNEKGERRLDAPDNFVTIEIAAALVRDIRVIPVLVDGARMPKVGDLPESLKPLARRQAIDLRHTHFGRVAVQAEEERKAKAAAEGEARAKAEQAEKERMAAVQAEEERKAKAAAEAETRAKAEQAEKERMAAVQAEEE